MLHVTADVAHVRERDESIPGDKTLGILNFDDELSPRAELKLPS